MLKILGEINVTVSNARVPINGRILRPNAFSAARLSWSRADVQIYKSSSIGNKLRNFSNLSRNEVWDMARLTLAQSRSRWGWYISQQLYSMCRSKCTTQGEYFSLTLSFHYINVPFDNSNFTFHCIVGFSLDSIMHFITLYHIMMWGESVSLHELNTLYIRQRLWGEGTRILLHQRCTNFFGCT